MQNFSRLQNCLRHKSSLSWNHSKIFSLTKLSLAQINIILQKFKDFFAFKIVLDASHHFPENIQRLFWLQNCLSRKSSSSWKHSNNFPPAKLSSTQIINILKIFKNFFACKIVLSANHHYAESIQRHFRLQYCLRWQSSLSWKHSKAFSLANCLGRKSSLSWKYAKFFSPAKLSSTQITIILKIFKDFFVRNIVLDANHHYPGNIQRLFLLQIVLAANHHYPENMQNFSRLQNCLRQKSSLSWNHSKIFSLAKLS